MIVTSKNEIIKRYNNTIQRSIKLMKKPNDAKPETHINFLVELHKKNSKIKYVNFFNIYFF